MHRLSLNSFLHSSLSVFFPFHFFSLSLLSLSPSSLWPSLSLLPSPLPFLFSFLSSLGLPPPPPPPPPSHPFCSNVHPTHFGTKSHTQPWSLGGPCLGRLPVQWGDGPVNQKSQLCTRAAGTLHWGHALGRGSSGRDAAHQGPADLPGEPPGSGLWDGQQILIWSAPPLTTPEKLFLRSTFLSFLSLQMLWGLLVATEVC